MRDGYDNHKHAKKQRQQSKEARKAVVNAAPAKHDPIPTAANQDHHQDMTRQASSAIVATANKVVPIKPPVPEVALDLPSRHWQTLLVLGLTLLLLFWLRQDALDQYWQQTRHRELGLSKLVADPNWQGGAIWTKQLDRELGEQLQVRHAAKERLVQTFNVLLFGLPEAGSQDKKAVTLARTSKPGELEKPAISIGENTASSPKLGLVSSSKLQSANQESASDANASGEGVAPLTQFVPLNEEGRMVLTPEDKVLLVGDSMMQGVAPHVARSLQNAHVKSIDLSRQSTGLTYPGYYDWPAVIKKTLEKERISVLVVFLGANDTWDMILGGKYESFGTERWQSNYLERIQSIKQIAHQQHVRVIWLGAPNMGREKINRGVKVLNTLYAKGFAEGESRFVSTRESLSDDVNEYRKSITKDNGKSVVVRTEDGIHFTRDGQIILRDLVLKQLELPVVNKVSP